MPAFMGWIPSESIRFAISHLVVGGAAPTFLNVDVTAQHFHDEFFTLAEWSGRVTFATRIKSNHCFNETCFRFDEYFRFSLANVTSDADIRSRESDLSTSISICPC